MAELGVESNGIKSSRPRLHYLDWLRVLAILMVFLFHAVHPFDFGDWQIKNIEQSKILTILLTLLGIWGMPFFFMVAGAASWFALQNRTPSQYIQERLKRLVIPFIVCMILFSPFQMYLEWENKVQRGVVTTSFQEFALRPLSDGTLLGWITPRWFGYGFHLWFLGFLFSFALITLPLFLWLKQGRGQSFLSWMAGLSECRGLILLFVLPLALVYGLVQPYFPTEQDWADFIYQMMFFILGFIFFAEVRFSRAIRRDWWIFMILGIVIVLALVGIYLIGLPILDWGETPGMPQFYILQLLVSLLALCCCLLMLVIGQRFLDFSNHRLHYGQEAALPFFVLHQPVIIVIAFFVVQWEIGAWIKLPLVVTSSFVFTIFLYELIIRRLPTLRLIFGMKTRISETGQVDAG
jgi:peptidoglycan/LPS O-acetylase OafA/YrhL